MRALLALAPEDLAARLLFTLRPLQLLLLVESAGDFSTHNGRTFDVRIVRATSRRERVPQSLYSGDVTRRANNPISRHSPEC
jgi:hypothetical protein